jgi:hypothetical protein
MGFSSGDFIRIISRFKTTSVLAPLLVAGSILCLAAFGVTWRVGPDHALTWNALDFRDLLLVFRDRWCLHSLVDCKSGQVAD